jgi:predicted acylesterase/phospholipase RssA
MSTPVNQIPAAGQSALCRVLTLDGGGAKGFYTLGVLKHIESMVGSRLSERFDLIFGTSTGAIIAALLALGKSVDEIHALYKDHVPAVMRAKSKYAKSQALEELANTVFAKARFEDVKTGLGIVATRWDFDTPMIFKASVAQAHGRKDTFVPGFGCLISDAVQASCSAYPFFERKIVTTQSGDRIELIDGGYCANNPTLYAIADATMALKKELGDLRIVSVGVGIYPEPKKYGWPWVVKQLRSVQLLQKTLNINTLSMERLRTVLFNEVPTVRINETFATPEMATDLMEHDLVKLNTLFQCGGESFAKNEVQLREFLLR